MQIDQAIVLPHADGALVQTHAVETQEAARLSNTLGDLTQYCFGNVTGLTQLLEILLAQELPILLEGAGVLANEGFVHGSEF
ncbi:hypothetical protein HRbin36_02813 [bacterium HR36]|nr:hypothetical protein HRbin36_02813 [bacterium HR36]